MLKSHSSLLIANDLENYSRVINSCYLSNKADYPEKKCAELRSEIINKCEKQKIPGIITENYAPKDDENIQKGERVFYTHENALLIDTYRNLIDETFFNLYIKNNICIEKFWFKRSYWKFLIGMLRKDCDKTLPKKCKVLFNYSSKRNGAITFKFHN